MKRRHFYIGIVAASVMTALLTAVAVSHVSKPESIQTKTVEVLSNAGVGSHFTSYDREKYPDLTYAAENAVKAVVNIEKIEEITANPYGSRGFDPFFEFFNIDPQQQSVPRERRSGGSGVIISSDGYIVTNNHVIENAKTLRVTLNDNRVFEGTLVGTDPATDVALIKIGAQDLPTLIFGSSDELRLGEWVLAIGSPFDLKSTITAGIVSAKARNLSVITDNYGIESFIQTDAAVNPGNSGGALVNVRGELVGINTVIKSPTGAYAGYSFAVPETIVKKVVMDLKEYGVVQRALLGVQYIYIDGAFLEEFGEEYGVSEIGGVYVSEVVRDGAAEAAGIKKGDVITEIDGVKLDASSTLQEVVAKHRPNDKIKLSVKNKGKVKQIEVVLRNKAGKAELLSQDYIDPAKALGGTFSDITEKARKDLRIDGGIMVRSVAEGGILSKCRVKRGYIITQINDKSIRSVQDLNKITEKITNIDGVYPDGRSASFALVD